MKRRGYRDFSEHILYDMNARRIMMTDIYQTKDYLNTEYLILFSKGNSRIYDLFRDFSLDAKLEFYLNLDMLTYLPFDKLGYDYLNAKLAQNNSNVIDFKYEKILKMLDDAKFNVDDEARADIKYFLNNYYNDVVEINVIGLAIMLLRLFHRYVTIMNFGAFAGGSMSIHKKIGKIMDEIVEEVNQKGLKEININDYLPSFDFDNNQLNEEMIEYIKLCLKRES